MHKRGGGFDEIANFIMSSEDYDIWEKLKLGDAELSYGDAEFRDANIMRARSLCTSVSPAKKNLAVFLKYS